MEGEVSVVDSTQRLKWEVTKEEYDNCEFPQHIPSPTFSVHVGKEKSKWMMALWPKGFVNTRNKEVHKDKVTIVLYLLPGDVKYTVQGEITVKTKNGFKSDYVESLYANKGQMEVERKLLKMVFNGNGTTGERSKASLFPKEQFDRFFSDENKLTVVTTLVLYVEGENYIQHREMARNFVANHRSISNLGKFSDFTIICGDEQFKCHRTILASMSTVFNTMLTNEQFLESKENVVEIMDSSPDLVEAMLYFMSNGIIPNNIDAKAFGLIYLADKYNLQDLKKACERSIVNNMTVENVIETLIIVDLYIPQSENRQKMIDFIKSNAIQVTEVEDWPRFLHNYPALVTEVFRAMAAKP